MIVPTATANYESARNVTMKFITAKQIGDGLPLH
jgi:hypothetical protein